MYSDIDFYGLSEEKQRRLIRSKRAATTTRLLREIPEGEPAVRVFEKTLEELIFERLESGRFTINQLAEEFGVAGGDVKRIVNKYRRRGKDGFTGEFFKYNLLSDRNGVVRVKGLDGKQFQYTIEMIPYFARIADPTLALSLLELGERFRDLPTLIEDIPAGAASEVDETYALVLGDFWNLDPQVIFDEITEYDRTYVETTVAPLPILDDSEEYVNVRSKFSQPDNVYERFRNIARSVEEIGNTFMETVERGQPGVHMYQVVSMELADVKRAAELQSPSSRSIVEEQIEQVMTTLDPESTIDDPFGPSTETSPEDISIEAEVQVVLGEDWKTADQVHRSLPPDVQAGTTIDDVQLELDRLASLGVISSRSGTNGAEYSSDTGTVKTKDGM